jgi:xylulokinase
MPAPWPKATRGRRPRGGALGLDIGTTGVKGLLIDGTGVTVSEATAAHDLHSPHPGWAEENPADWWAGLCAVARELAGDPRGASAPGGAGAIAAVGVSGMVPAIVLLDEGGVPVRPSIQQNDARAFAEVEELRAGLDQDEVLARTGSTTSAQHVGPRLRWVQRHEPQVWARVRTVLGSYDYVRLRLTGRRLLELNWAVESGLWDVHTGSWVPAYLEAAGLRPDQLPPVRRPDAGAGRVTRRAAAETGLREGTAVAVGSADHVASALAAGVTRPGDLLIKFGGAGDILCYADRPHVDPRLFLDAHVMPGKWLPNGCMAASGSLVKWLLTEVFGLPAGGSTLAQFDRAAAALPPGAGGLVCLPYFLGEKTPLFDPLARGLFAGLTLSHGRPHLFRAALEAVIYGFQHHVDVLAENGLSIERVFATDGGVRSDLWRSIAADVLGREIVSFPGHPGSALGAAFVAGMHGGLFAGWDEIARFLTHRRVDRPDPARHKRYRELYGIYRRLYPALKDEFGRLARLGEEL